MNGTGNWLPLPAAETIGITLGGRRAGSGWRIPHLCGGEAPGSGVKPGAGLSVRDSGSETVVKCFYGCDNADAYAAVRSAMGMDAPGWTPPPAPAPKPPVVRGPFVQPAYPAPAGYSLVDGTGYPDLPDDGRSLKDALRDIRGRWTGWIPYLLPDGDLRKEIREYPTGRRGWDMDVGRPTAGAMPAIIGNVHSPAVVVCEGAGAGIAVHRAAPDVAVAIVPGAVALGNLATIRGIADWGFERAIIWGDADDDGRRGAMRAAAILRDDARIETVVLAGLPVGVVKGWDAADAETDTVRAIVNAALAAKKSQRLESITVETQSPNDLTFLPEPTRPDELRCRTPKAQWRTFSADRAPALLLLDCNTCERCAEWKRRRDVIRYAHGRAPGPQTVISWQWRDDDAIRRDAWAAAKAAHPRAPLERVSEAADVLAAAAHATAEKDLRRFLRAQHKRVKDQLDGENLPRVSVNAEGWLTMIYAAPLVGGVRTLTERAITKMAMAALDGQGFPDAAARTAAIKALVGRMLCDRELTGGEFGRLVPDCRMQKSGAGDDVKLPAMLSVNFSTEWPAQFVKPATAYAYADGVVEDAATDSEQEVSALIQWRFKQGMDYAAAANTVDWLSGDDRAPEPVFWADLCDAVRGGGDTDEAMAAFRQATGYDGPAALPRDSVDGQRQCHLIFRNWAEGRGLPDDVLLPERAQKLAGRRRRGGDEAERVTPVTPEEIMEALGMDGHINPAVVLSDRQTMAGRFQTCPHCGLQAPAEHGRRVMICGLGAGDGCGSHWDTYMGTVVKPAAETRPAQTRADVIAMLAACEAADAAMEAGAAGRQ